MASALAVEADIVPLRPFSASGALLACELDFDVFALEIVIVFLVDCFLGCFEGLEGHKCKSAFDGAFFDFPALLE